MEIRLEPLEKDPRIQARIYRWPLERKFSSGHCFHDGSVTYDESRRLLECEACGAPLDPFDWIVKWARREDRKQEIANNGIRAQRCLEWLVENGGALHITRDGAVNASLGKRGGFVTRSSAFGLDRIIYAIETLSRRLQRPEAVPSEAQPQQSEPGVKHENEPTRSR